MPDFVTNHFITAGGVAIAYDEWLSGEFPVVMFLHATGFNRGVWRPHGRALLDRAEGHCRTVAVDLRGHGASGKPPPPYRWRFFIEDVIELLDARGWRDIVLCGHSVGGSTAVEVAAERPDLVRALVLLEPALQPASARPSGANAEAGSALVTRTLRRRSVWASRAEAAAYLRQRQPYDAWDEAAFAGYIEAGTEPSPDGGVQLACPPEIEASVFSEAGGSKAWERLPEVRCPTWVARGTGVRGMPSTASPEAVTRLAQGSEVLALGAGHFAPLERVDWAVDIVSDALRSAVRNLH